MRADLFICLFFVLGITLGLSGVGWCGGGSVKVLKTHGVLCYRLF